MRIFFQELFIYFFSGRHSKSRTKWSTRGPYDLTYSMCRLSTRHSMPSSSRVLSSNSCLIWDRDFSAHSIHSCFCSPFWAFALDFLMSTLAWMCRNPPVSFRRARHAVGQLSSLDGIKPRLTRSAQFSGHFCQFRGN